MDPSSTLFLICDIQERFRAAIANFELVVATTNKLLRVAKILGSEVLVTTQKAAALGPIDPSVDLESLGSLHIGTYDKTLFSMLTPPVLEQLNKRSNIKSIVLLGIESHICVLQTALALRALPANYTTYVIADGVSSCNPAEIPLALYVPFTLADAASYIIQSATMRAAGIVVTSSESLSYQLVRDAAIPEFKSFAQVIKEEKATTSKVVETLLGRL
ncbi:hypothetical protein MKEN_00053200 [Mycena kentingensis (nom. inval.)]|nr:hypothetical protein MKEN_00053200 [Mycena kentingensis (nom. inval.)]